MVWAVPRAPYASNPEHSRGRLHPEPEHEMRSPFQRDRDRIIHSSAFRRLKHPDDRTPLDQVRRMIVPHSPHEAGEYQ